MYLLLFVTTFIRIIIAEVIKEIIIIHIANIFLIIPFVFLPFLNIYYE